MYHQIFGAKESGFQEVEFSEIACLEDSNLNTAMHSIKSSNSEHITRESTVGTISFAMSNIIKAMWMLHILASSIVVRPPPNLILTSKVENWSALFILTERPVQIASNLLQYWPLPGVGNCQCHKIFYVVPVDDRLHTGG